MLELDKERLSASVWVETVPAAADRSEIWRCGPAGFVTSRTSQTRSSTEEGVTISVADAIVVQQLLLW